MVMSNKMYNLPTQKYGEDHLHITGADCEDVKWMSWIW